MSTTDCVCVIVLITSKTDSVRECWASLHCCPPTCTCTCTYVHVVWLNVAYTPAGSENNAVYVYAKQVSSPMLTYQYNAPRGLLVRHHNLHVHVHISHLTFVSCIPALILWESFWLNILCGALKFFNLFPIEFPNAQTCENHRIWGVGLNIAACVHVHAMQYCAIWIPWWLWQNVVL